MTKYKKTPKNASKIWLPNETKKKNPNTSSHMLLDHYYRFVFFCCSLLVWRRSSLKKGTPYDLFLPRPGSAPGRILPKNNNTCKGPWVLHSYQVSSKSTNGKLIALIHWHFTSQLTLRGAFSSFALTTEATPMVYTNVQMDEFFRGSTWYIH